MFGSSMTASSGAATGGVRLVLRLEGLVVLIAALVANSKYGFDWGTFALYFLLPDLSFIGYAFGTKFGAVSYNLAHSYVGAVICMVSGLMLVQPTLLGAGILWCSHIGFDRALGYGLKYSAGFSYTHLGVIGRIGKASTVEDKSTV